MSTGTKQKNWFSLKNFIKDNFIVLILYLIALATSLLFIYNFDKDTIHLYLNSYVGDKYLNLFFYYITYFGDGRFVAIFLLLILIYNTRLGITTTVSFLCATIVSTVLKYTYFDDDNRPFFIFSYINRHTLNLVEGVDVHIHNTFPSGHATQAFAVLMCMAFAVKKNSAKLLFFFLALLTAFSRVYLSQHWLVDITAGSFIGFFFAVLFYYLWILRDKLRRFNVPLLNLKKAP